LEPSLNFSNQENCSIEWKNLAMAETFYKIRQILHDIRHSWYFRFWGILWIVCAIVVFAILIVLGQTANQTFQQKDVRIWGENVSSITYPSFHFRIGGGNLNETFTSLTCEQNGVWLNNRNCMGDPFINTQQYCIAVNSENFTAVQNNSNFGEYWTNRIRCNISTTGNVGNLLIAFEIEDPNVQTIGPNGYASIWIAPNQHAWVELDKSIYTNSSGLDTIQWYRSLIYHSTIGITGQYNVSVDIGGYWVSHVEQSDIYSGFMSMGDVGGFGFFMLVIHALLMIIIGICFANTSEFLGGKSTTPVDRRGNLWIM